MLALLIGLLRLLLVLLVVRIVGRFVGAVIRGYRGQFAAAPPAPPAAALGARELVRDPVCGTFVARDRALQAAIDGEARYFCSTACRDAAVAGLAPKALHG